jgi:hypothetical protein
MRNDFLFLLEGDGHMYDRLDRFFKLNTANEKGKYNLSKQFTQRWDKVQDHLRRTQFRLNKEYKSFALLTNEESVALLEEALLVMPD